ncbi:MAG: hypothetical protein ISS25_02855 [Nanoarchaeota archaeon]|nr:hypothetical protein [DPANN group archaeon]MBL7116740.1 hypothetical protein [Nanoarchaeota archaeon]
MKTKDVLDVNETLEAIVDGLDVNQNDVVLSVVGNGDQPLVLLERAARVIAIDNDPAALRLLNQRIKQLVDDEYFDFVGDQPAISNHYFEARAAYLQQERRLSTIRAKLDRLTIVSGDIFEFVKSNRSFNKVYLSNAITYNGYDEQVFHDRLETVAKSLPREGLIYVADGCDVRWDREHVLEFERSLPSSLAIDFDLSWIARIKDDHWQPNVYRKDLSLVNKLYKKLRFVIPM